MREETRKREGKGGVWGEGVEMREDEREETKEERGNCKILLCVTTNCNT